MTVRRRMRPPWAGAALLLACNWCTAGGLSTPQAGSISRLRPLIQSKVPPWSRRMARVRGGADNATLPLHHGSQTSAPVPQDAEEDEATNHDAEDDDTFTVAAGLAAIEANSEQALAEGVSEDEGDGADAPEDAAQKKVAKWSDPHKELRYRVVAILGCQASGKSTLLNQVFGTSFPVLNATATGIQRTTKGIWADVHRRRSDGLPMVILDMEGLESAARGEQAPVFDRRVACMASSVADVVLINVWHHDVASGRLTGVTQLFHELANLRPERRRPRRVVVVLRDMEGAGKARDIALRPFRTSLGQALREAFQCAGGEASSAREGVDLRVVGLPHPRYEEAEFWEGVVELRRLLIEEEQARGSGAKAMRQQTQMESRLHPVPLPGFASFARGLWESLRGPQWAHVKDKEEGRGGMGEEIRAFTRQRIVEGCVADADKAIKRLQAKVDGAVDMPILEFGPDAQAIFSNALSSLSSRLHGQTETNNRRRHKAGQAKEEEGGLRREVVSQLCRRLQPLYSQHLEALGYYFGAKFADRFAGLFCPVSQFDIEAAALLDDICGTFEKAAKLARPKETADVWDIEAPLARLREEMEVDIVDRRIEVEVAFPRELGGGNRMMRAAWWKKVLLKALVLYVNYLQTVHAVQAVSRAARRRQQKYPPFPLF